MSRRVSPQMMIEGAAEFLEVALKAHPRPKTNVEKFKSQSTKFAVYYLIGHSIELSLKAFLMGRGETKNMLRNQYGHNLEKLISNASRRQLWREVKLTKKEIAMIQLLNQPYQAKLLEYTETGMYKFPYYYEILEVAEKLIDGLRGYCYRKTVNKALQVDR